MTAPGRQRWIVNDTDELLAFAKDQGWRVTKTNGGHIRLSRYGTRPVFIASTPSDRRSLANCVRDIRHAQEDSGFDFCARHKQFVLKGTECKRCSAMPQATASMVKSRVIHLAPRPAPAPEPASAPIVEGSSVPPPATTPAPWESIVRKALCGYVYFTEAQQIIARAIAEGKFKSIRDLIAKAGLSNSAYYKWKSEGYLRRDSLDSLVAFIEKGTPIKAPEADAPEASAPAEAPDLPPVPDVPSEEPTPAPAPEPAPAPLPAAAPPLGFEDAAALFDACRVAVKAYPTRAAQYKRLMAHFSAEMVRLA